MKIAIDARELRTSTGRYIERLLYYLQQLDKKNSYFVLLKPKDIDGWEVINPRFTAVPCPYEEFTFAEQIAFKRQLDKLSVDLVHFGMTQQPVLYKGKTVTTIHDLTTLRFRNPAKNPLIFWIKQQIYAWLTKKVAKKSAQIITPTEFVKKDIINYCHVAESKITVTLESADILTDKPKIYQPIKNRSFIMYVGRPTPHKNLDKLIDAFCILQKKHPEIHLVLVGKKDFNYKKHEERVAKNNIKNVVFTDFVSDDKLAWLYKNTSCYCFPSMSEGFGLPGLEAMLHGAPVASSSATCLPEVYGEAAEYFNPLSAKDMARTIDKILTNQKLRQDMAKRGLKHVKSFSWQKMAKQTLGVYEKVIFRDPKLD